MAILAERQDKCSMPGIIGGVDQDRVGTSEIGVSSIKLPPILRSEEIPSVGGRFQIGRQANDGFAAHPRTRSEGVAGCNKQGLSIGDRPAGRPNAAAARRRRPSDNFARIVQGDSHHPPVIVAAIAVMAAERNVKTSVRNSQRATLILIAGVESLATTPKRLRDVDRPAASLHP